MSEVGASIASRRRYRLVSTLGAVLLSATGLWAAAAAVGTQAAGAATALPTVALGYADNSTGLVPWGADNATSPAIAPTGSNLATYFIGRALCCSTHGPDITKSGYDSGAIEIDNTTSSSVEVTGVSVDIGAGIYSAEGFGANFGDIWNVANDSPDNLKLPITLSPGQTLVLAQDNQYNFDSSDTAGESCDPNSDAVPVVSVSTTIGSTSTTTAYDDTQQILNSEGTDLGSCANSLDESHDFTVVQPAGSQSTAAPAIGLDVDGNQVLPQIETGENYSSGSPTVGQSIMAQPGAFVGNPAPTLSYQWLTCSSTCTDASGTGATTLNYIPDPADVGNTLKIAVTATSSGQSVVGTSAATGVVQAQGSINGQFGDPSFPLTSAIYTADALNGSVFTAPVNATASDFRFLARGAGSASVWTPAIYSVNSNGTPGSLLDTAPAVTVPMATNQNWYTSTLSSPLSLTAGTKYFLALVAGNQGSDFGAYLSYNPIGGVGYADTLSSTTPPSSISGAAANSDDWTFYLDYASSAPAGPANTALPTISGNPYIGSQLTASTGTWTGSTPITYSYQWQACTSPTACSNISNQTASTFTPTSTYNGDTIDVVVTAANSVDSASATSAQTAAVTTAPSTIALGATTVGTSSSTPGSGYKFGSIFTAGSSGSTVDFRMYVSGGAAAQSFVPVLYSVSGGQPASLLGTGTTVTVAANAAAGWVSTPFSGVSITSGSSYLVGVLAGTTGSETANFYTTLSNGAFWNANSGGYPTPSSTWGQINQTNQQWDFAVDYAPAGPPTAPDNTGAPTIAGSPTVGSTLTASVGTWTGTAPITYSYQWQACTSPTVCSNISNQTASSFSPTSTYNGDTIDVVVTATNSVSAVSATSAQTAAVTTPSTVTLGNTTVGTTTSTPGNGIKFGSIFTAASSGTSVDLRLYVQGGSSAQSFVPFIYSVSGSQPASLLGSGSAVSVAAKQAAGWVTLPLSGISLTAGTSYMLGVLAGPTASSAKVFYTSATSGAFWNANAGGYPTPASTWGVINKTNQLWDVVVDYTP